jgi:hypothetical protein
MNAPIMKIKFIVFILMLATVVSCKKKEDPQPTQPLRSPISYSDLTATTPYGTFFKDETGVTTVDRTEGRNLLRMLEAIDVYCKSSIEAKTAIDSTKLSNMFRNQSGAFPDPYEDLNGLNYSIQKFTAKSTTYKTVTDNDIEKMIGALARSSQFIDNAAGNGNAGLYDGQYLVDTAGVENNVVLIEALIGALQLDYIGNYLLFTGLNADNHEIVPGTNYTQLEHNWDIAYGLLTSNDIYALGATDATMNDGESYLGARVWENNKAGYKQLYAAFLKGRTAIVNNDIGELKNQALIIRYILEKPVGISAGLHILAVVQANHETAGVRAHEFAQGYGLLYATRFCFLYTGTDAFSKKYMTKLLNSTVTRVEDIAYQTATPYEVQLDVQEEVLDKFGYYQQ